MPFASGNKKTQQQVDSRVSATGNAQVNQGGGILFNAAGSKQSTPTNYVPWIIGAVVAFMVWSLVIRK